MPNHLSAKKRVRQNDKRRMRNKANLTLMKTQIKKVQAAIEEKKHDTIDELLKVAQSTIARTRRKGAIHKNTMARRISRLTKAVNKSKQSPQK